MVSPGLHGLVQCIQTFACCGQEFPAALQHAVVSEHRLLLAHRLQVRNDVLLMAGGGMSGLKLRPGLARLGPAFGGRAQQPGLCLDGRFQRFVVQQTPVTDLRGRCDGRRAGGLVLQQIAANFVSGVILLLEGQTTVGDFVVLDNGEEGTIVKMTARAAILETVDGRWIVVPNEDFITSRVFNLSDAGKAHRYEAAFSVSYDTDINLVPDLIEAAVGALDFVLQGPGREVECELTAFADSGVEFSVEYWVEGIEDLTGKYRSVVLFAIWNALKGAEIEIPYPQRVVHHRGLPPTAMPEPAPHA